MILITGGNGFLGKLLQEEIKKNTLVRTVDINIKNAGDAITWDSLRYHLACNAWIEPKYTISITGIEK